MTIDWFTVAAQILNFVVLVWLLKRFLYGPVIRAMDAREERAVSRLKEARQREADAAEEAKKLRAERDAYKRAEDERFAELERDLDAERTRLLEDAREQVARARREWLEALDRDQAALMRTFRERAQVRLFDILRQALADVADGDIEQRAVDVFLERIVEVDRDELRALVAGDAPGDAPARQVEVRTAFNLPASQRERVARVLGECLQGDVDVAFGRDRALLAGMELRLAGRKFGWSLSSYLDGLEDELWNDVRRLVPDEELPADHARSDRRAG